MAENSLRLNGTDIGLYIALIDDDGNKVVADQTVKANLLRVYDSKWYNSVSGEFDIAVGSEPSPAELTLSQIASTGVYSTTLTGKYDSTKGIDYIVSLVLTGTVERSFTYLESLTLKETIDAIGLNIDSIHTEVDNPCTGIAAISSTVNNIDAAVAQIQTDISTLPTGFHKNTAFNNFEFAMVDSSDGLTPKTGLTITATRSIDGGAFAACTNSASEVGSGVYKINLSAADLNGDMITFKFTATGAATRLLTIKTDE